MGGGYGACMCPRVTDTSNGRAQRCRGNGTVRGKRRVPEAMVTKGSGYGYSAGFTRLR